MPAESKPQVPISGLPWAPAEPEGVVEEEVDADRQPAIVATKTASNRVSPVASGVVECPVTYQFSTDLPRAAAVRTPAYTMATSRSGAGRNGAPWRSGRDEALHGLDDPAQPHRFVEEDVGAGRECCLLGRLAARRD